MRRRSRSTDDLSPDWRELLSLLIAHRVKFVLVGGHAVAAHGHPRLTKDLDVFVQPTVANAAKLRRVLVAFGFVESAPTVRRLARRGPVLMIGVAQDAPVDAGTSSTSTMSTCPLIGRR